MTKNYLIPTLLLTAMLAGCAGNTGGETLDYQLTQCESPPWGDAADASAIAKHYGVTVADLEELDDGSVVAAVCGEASSTFIRVVVEGNTTTMQDDGWA